MASNAGGQRLVLASGSPRRRDLLARAGIAIAAIDPPDIDERPRKKELPQAYVERMAAEKLDAVAERWPGAFVLAADTVVACGRRILPKTEEEDSAAACLDLLSGKRHRVRTAVVVRAPDGRLSRKSAMTVVSFKRLDRGERARYLASGEWRGKAGGYAIQGMADMFVTRVNGSYSNVVGLPTQLACAMLGGLGWLFAPRAEDP